MSSYWKYSLKDMTRDDRMPEPTKSELKARYLLKKIGIPFEVEHKLFFSLSRFYTPDLIVGGNLIVEIDGKIHDRSWMKTPDRIRQRALEMMGYTVIRIKNEELNANPERCADFIREKFYQVTGVSKESKINRIPTQMRGGKKTSIEISKQAQKLLKENSSLLQYESPQFEESLEEIMTGASREPEIVEIALLRKFGYSLVSEKDSKYLDFHSAAESFKNCLSIAENLLGPYGVVGLENSFLITAPNFIKNLVFNGGPRVKPNIVEITSEDELNFTIDRFNQYFREFGVTVDKSDVLAECKEALKIRNPSRLAWLSTLCGLA
jgi:hypothetical protein